MKKNILTFAISLLQSIVIAQDLGVEYVNYSNGTLLNSSNLPDGKIQCHFRIINHGTSTINPGDQVYVSAKINGTYYILDLYSTGASAISPSSSVPPGGSFTHNPGYLHGPSTLAYLGASSVEICIVVYGVGASSVNNSFPGDPNPCNNTTCVLYSNSVSSYNYNCPFTSTLAFHEAEKKLHIYPLPVQNVMNIEFKDPVLNLNKVVITNSTGTKTWEHQLSSQENIHTLELQFLPEGIYFCSFYSNDNLLTTHKIAVQ